MSLDLPALEPGTGNHILSNGFQHPPKQTVPSALRPPKTRKRLSMSITSIPIVNSSNPGSPSQSSTSKPLTERLPSRSISLTHQPSHFRGSSISVASHTQLNSPESSRSKSSSNDLVLPESLSNLNDALMSKSHRTLRSRSASLTLSLHSSASQNFNSQGLASHSSENDPSNSSLDSPIALPTSMPLIPSSSSQVTLTAETRSPSLASLTTGSSSSLVVAPSEQQVTNSSAGPASIPRTGHHQQTYSSSSVSSSGSTTPGSSAATSAVEYYFSQLAFRERRIVELRDEINRMQQKLVQAEEDLEAFKKQVPTKDIVRPNNSSSASTSSSPKGNLKRSASMQKRLVMSHAPTSLSDRSGSPFQNNTSSNQRSSYPLHSHASESSTSTISSSRHSNSLSNSSASSISSSILEEPNESSKNASPSLNFFNSSKYGNFSAYQSNMHPPSGSVTNNYAPDSFNTNNNNNNNQRIHGMSLSTDFSFEDGAYYASGGVNSGLYDKVDPNGSGTTDHVIHYGKRVVEEIGTQFWSFIEDIKNVTVGDDARNTGSHSGGLQQGHHGKSKSLAVNQSLSKQPYKRSVNTTLYQPDSKDTENRRQFNPTFPPPSTPLSSGRLPRSAMSMGNLHAQLIDESDEPPCTPVSSKHVTLNSSPSYSPSFKSCNTSHPVHPNSSSFSSPTSSMTTPKTNQPLPSSVSVSSISTKGLASEMGTAVSRHRTRNSVSLGRSATIGGGLSRRAAKTTAENSYYMV